MPRRPQFALAAGLLALATGCHHLPVLEDHVFGPGFTVTNVARSSILLPTTLRRVAVLPLAPAGTDGELETGCSALEPLLRAELGKARAFELTFVTPEELRRWTGQRVWRGDDPLPLDFFALLKAHAGADAVLFGQVTRYHPYPPLAVGWKFKLVDTDQTVSWWSVDEIFDAGVPPVANSARRYSQQNFHTPTPLADSRNILGSPRRFGQYTLAAVLETLPER